METANIQQVQDILDAIHADFTRHADAANIRKYVKYFKEGYHGYGVGRDEFMTLLDRYWNISRERLSPPELLVLLDELFHAAHYEDQSLAILFLNRMRGEYSQELFGRIHHWFDPCIRNWAHTDIISQKVLAPFLNDGIIGLHDFDNWLVSPHKWTRRAVPVTLIYLRDLADRVPECLAMIRPLMTDDEAMVHKGVGWFIREAWKKTPAPVEDYLLEWKDIAPRLIFQYATEKIPKEERQRFRRSKK